MRVRIARSAQKRRHAVNGGGAGRSPSAARTCRHDRAVRQSTRRLSPPAQATAACTHAHTHCHALRHWPMDSDRAPVLWIEQCAEQAPEHIPSRTKQCALNRRGHTPHPPHRPLCCVCWRAWLGASAQMSMGYILRAVALVCNRDAAVTRLPAQRRALCPEDCEPREPTEHELG